jgi:hypothetical protein
MLALGQVLGLGVELAGYVMRNLGAIDQELWQRASTGVNERVHTLLGHALGRDTALDGKLHEQGF